MEMRKAGTFYLGRGPGKTKPDVTITVGDKDMVNLSTGKLNVRSVCAPDVHLLILSPSVASNGLYEGKDQGQGKPDAGLAMVRISCRPRFVRSNLLSTSTAKPCCRRKLPS